MRVGWGLRSLGVAGAALAALAVPAMAQTPPDTVRVDSTKIRIENALRSLNKPLGVDSTLMIDTLRGRRGPQQQAAGPPPSDTIMAALLELGGYTATRYQGNRAVFGGGTERLVLEGAEGSPARLEQPGQTLVAQDTITYDDEKGLVWTAGATTTTRPGEDPVESESIVYSLQDDRGSARQARTSFREGGNWIIQGDLPSIVPDTVFGHRILFTSCQEEHPHYHFAAREAKIVGGGWMVVRNVTLNFDDVPVMWLPFIFQNVETGRSSGILTPRFSVNDIVRTSRGQSRRISNVGFFWAINDYSDMTVSMDWWSGNFTSLTGGFRYNVERQFLNGAVNFRRFWREGGGREFGLDTRHTWEISERMRFDASARFITDAGFVRQNSFDPREVTGSIDSQGGVNRRFDWGSISLNGNRKQFLNDDRVEMTLPQVNMSLKPITLFQAPSSRAGFFNNMTWTGSANAARRTTDRAEQDPNMIFNRSQVDRETTTGGVSSSLNAGALRFSQSLRFTENRELGIPLGALDPDIDSVFVAGSELTDVASSEVSWNLSLDYQQRLIGTTTFTPNLKLDGRLVRDDEIEEALSYVSAPKRFSFGATLKSDLYGLWGGIGSFEAIRHKISPSINYQYAPATVPTDLQTLVFGSTELQARNVISLTLNQTFEAKRRPREDQAPPATDTSGADEGLTGLAGVEGAEQAPEEAADPDAEPALGIDPAERGAGQPTGRPAPGGAGAASEDEGPQRIETGEIVNLLSLQTSAVTYDFTRASEDGADRLDGFTTTRLRNQVSSDFLRGLSISMEHDLFGTSDSGVRTFDPQLTQVNLSFQMTNNSGIIRAIGGLLGQGGEERTPEEIEEEEALLEETEDEFLFDDVANASLTDEATMVPGADGNDIIDPRSNAPGAGRRRSGVGGWTAGIQYSLSRSRDTGQQTTQFGSGTVQMIQANVRFRPTEKWEMSWRTSFDIESSAFNDHTIRLTRDLHRWQADFDFLQTATGNWTFRFQVSLSDNRDLKFDYEQRNRDQIGSQR